MASPSQPKSLIFDLEVAPGKAGQPDCFMAGAPRPDTGEALERKVDKDLSVVLNALCSPGCFDRWPVKQHNTGPLQNAA